MQAETLDIISMQVCGQPGQKAFLIPYPCPCRGQIVDKAARIRGIQLNDLQASGRESLDLPPWRRVLAEESLFEGKVNVLQIQADMCENDSLLEDFSF